MRLSALLLIAPLLFATQTGAAGRDCAQTFAELSKAHRVAELLPLGYSREAAKRLSSARPDIVEAIFELKNKRSNPYKIFAPEALPDWAVREKLTPYFKKDLWKPVKLYRGIDQETFSPQNMGEKFLVFTSEKFEKTVGYALNDPSAKHALILELEVPRFLVYERSGWPVLRLEDAPDLKPFVHQVGILPIRGPLRRAMDDGQDVDVLIEIVKKHPPRWKRGKAIEQFIDSD